MKTKHFPYFVILTLLLWAFLTAAAPGPGGGLFHPPFPITLPGAGGPTHDYGDAPDSGNAAGANFAAYPGVLGNFPTSLTSNGPWHDNTTLAFYLGNGVSGEDFPDSGFDTDPDGNNLIITGTLGLAADNDGADNGLVLPKQFPHCQVVSLQFTVTVPDTFPGTTVAYANLWFDWDRSGDWGGGTASCPGAAGASEWSVQNMPLTLSGPGTYTFATPAFIAWNPDPDQPMWVRVSVAEQTATVDDGSGPAAGYTFGETEDYLWANKYTIFLPTVVGGGGPSDPPPADDDDTHVDESIPTEVQFTWAQIPTDDSSVVLDIDNLLLTFANNGPNDKQIEYLLTIFSGGEQTLYRSEPIPLGPGEIVTDPVSAALLLPAVQKIREAARLMGEVIVTDLATGKFYKVEIPFIAFHPEATDPEGKIVVYNDLGLARQMGALDFDQNDAIGPMLEAIIPADEDPSLLADLVMYTYEDPVVLEDSEDPGTSEDFPPPGAGLGDGSLNLITLPESPQMFSFIFCMEWYVAPTDNGFGEDYGTQDSGWRARGAKMALWQDGTKIFDGYLNRYGCAIVNTTSNEGVYASWKGEARLESGGGYITVRHLSSSANDASDIVNYSVWIDNVYSGQVYRPEMWNFDSMGMLAYGAQERFNGGVNGVTYYLKKAGCGDDPDKGSCATSMYGQPGIFMSSGQYRRKFILAHEYGHRLLASVADYKNDCSHNGSGHGMKGIEYGSCAAMEGWGHFVAVDMWNAHPHDDASELNPDGIIVYWDGSNTVYHAEIGSDQPYCHQQYPDGLIFVCDFFGYELDWMRQWWDYHTNPGNRPAHSELFDLVDDTVWENGTFEAAQAIKDALGGNSGRWNDFVCWNGIAGTFYGCE